MRINKTKLDNFLLGLLITSLYFGRINVDIGFTIKPYMIVTLIIFVYILNDIKIRRLYKFEIYMVSFIIVYSLTALRFSYPEYSVRYILAFIVLMIFYFTIRTFFERVSIEMIKGQLVYCSIISLVISLIYYILGVISASSISNWNNIRIYGTLLDRGTPRMIGFISNDPNIFVFFITISFIYGLSNLKKNNCKVLTFISGLCIILSFSRGAYLALGISVMFIILIRGKLLDKIKSLLIVLILIIGFIFIAKFFGIDIIDIVLSRFADLASDGGTGRVELWKNALKTFADNPIFGIGINATIPYGIANYGWDLYVHNTILEVLSEGGIISFSLFSIWILSLYVYCFRLYKCNKENIFIVVTCVALICQVIFLSILYNEVLYFFIILIYKFVTESNKKEI